jgi:hypothetical protein
MDVGHLQNMTLLHCRMSQLPSSCTCVGFSVFLLLLMMPTHVPKTV